MLDISGWEFLTLGIIAVIVFGPDKLPKFAADAGRLMKQVRHYVNGAKDELTRELGPEFADVKVSDLTPRGMMKKALGPDDPFEELRQSIDIRKDVDQFRDLRNPMQFGAPKQEEESRTQSKADDASSTSAIGKRQAEAARAANVAATSNGSATRAAAPAANGAANGAAPRASRALADNEIPPIDLDAT
ncbi:twin-arginine translocase TatA/TatE family subunit [Sporichthya polymorpha]|uniref:twin-arginine translocase TatA/TatE family subunit n=1 Tax=Sporichthya polymorpha TaxID=35751 RepID=UPI00035D99D0|nr:twin-arginine translocase TatA/TatE family subunit [Sporichthya polymorpha]